MKKPIFKSREVDFSSVESKERIKKVLETQKRIRMDARKPTIDQMRKIHFTF
jgi:preprotein translocase subunit Sss1